jgi:hypothetical protein
MVKNTTAEVLNGIATKNWNYFVTGKTGIKYLKSPFLSNQKKSMTTLIINIKELLQVR